MQGRFKIHSGITGRRREGGAVGQGGRGANRQSTTEWIFWLSLRPCWGGKDIYKAVHNLGISREGRQRSGALSMVVRLWGKGGRGKRGPDKVQNGRGGGSLGHKRQTTASVKGKRIENFKV